MSRYLGLLERSASNDVTLAWTGSDVLRDVVVSLVDGNATPDRLRKLWNCRRRLLQLSAVFYVASFVNGGENGAEI